MPPTHARPKLSHHPEVETPKLRNCPQIHLKLEYLLEPVDKGTIRSALSGSVLGDSCYPSVGPALACTPALHCLVELTEDLL